MDAWSVRRVAADVRSAAERDGRSPEWLVEQIVVQCRVSRLRAHRLARGWTLVEVASGVRELLAQGPGPHRTGRAGPGHTRVSRWETGERPSARCLDALCLLFGARADVLGFGIDPPAARGGPQHGTRPQHGTGRDDGGPERLRRALSPPDPVSAASAAWWRQEALRQASRYRQVPAAGHLDEVTAQVDAVGGLLRQGPGPRSRTDLARAAAHLSGLAGILLVDLGRPRAARDWFQAGRQAAESGQDAQLAAWLLAREALAALYFRRPHEALDLARRAEQRAGQERGVAGALAPAVAARALARTGHGDEARRALRQAEARQARLAAGEPVGALGFSDGKLRFYQGDVLARVGEPAQARDLCRSVLAGPVRQDVVDRAHVSLNLSIALLRLGHPADGAARAGRTLAALRGAGSGATVLADARDLIHRMERDGAPAAAHEVRAALRTLTDHPDASDHPDPGDPS